MLSGTLEHAIYLTECEQLQAMEDAIDEYEYEQWIANGGEPYNPANNVVIYEVDPEADANIPF